MNIIINPGYSLQDCDSSIQMCQDRILAIHLKFSSFIDELDLLADSQSHLDGQSTVKN